ncbi:MAG: MerR family transcriptional regulator [Desulfovibrionaceae bacterium]
MKEELYTHIDLSKLLGVSVTTIKSYRRKFPNCIPISSTGKPIHFTKDSLAVCKKIKEYFEDGMAVPEIHHRLAKEFSWVSAREKKTKNANQKNNSDLHLALNSIAQGVMSLLQQQKDIARRLGKLESSLFQETNLLPSSSVKMFEIPDEILSIPIVIQAQDNTLVSITGTNLPHFVLEDFIALLTHRFKHPHHYTAQTLKNGNTIQILFSQPSGGQERKDFIISLTPLSTEKREFLLLQKFSINAIKTSLEDFADFIHSL